MKSLLLGNNNDLSIVNNSFQVIEGEIELQQQIKNRLKVFRGECFLDTSKGIPYLTDVMGKNRNFSLISDLFKDEILSIDNVESLESFNLELDSDRKLNIKSTVNGNLEIEESI